MIDFASFCFCLGLACFGALLGEIARLTFGWNRWLHASFGWSMAFAAAIVYANTAILAATGGITEVYSRGDFVAACAGWLLYAVAWLLSVNALGVILRKTSRPPAP
jgi:ABC-type Co2+ transport system permease subunit